MENSRLIAGQWLSEYDAQTIEYLQASGVDRSLVERVARSLAAAR